MTEDEFGFERKRAEFDIDTAPLTNDFLEEHPEMWPRISSFVPAGWAAEIAGALRALVDLSTETVVGIRVSQVKSKLGGLRIYVDIDEDSLGPVEIVDSTPISTRFRSSSTHGSVRDRARAIVDAAGARCEELCELCGAPGVLRNESGWLRTACDAHARPGSNPAMAT
jgi:hypothetical protein